MEMQPIQPNKPLTVTMVAERWNIILLVMRKHDMPFDVSSPIIGDLSSQLQQQAVMSTETVAEELDVSDQDNR